jgi:hypothetical protein
MIFVASALFQKLAFSFTIKMDLLPAFVETELGTAWHNQK